MTGDPISVGVDVGTTNTKVVAATAECTLTLRTMVTPEQPDALINGVLGLIAAVVEACPRPPQAVGIAGMAETGFVLGPDGPLTPWLRWDARRDAGPIEAVVRSVGREALVRATGVRPGPKPPLGVWLTLDPGLRGRMRSWLGAPEAVHHALTGVARTDHTLAGRTMAYRLPEPAAPLAATFDADLCALAGVAVEQTPTVGLPGDELDVVGASVASTTGLRTGTPVLVAGHDHQVAAWAAGVRSPGQVADSVGTAEAVLTLLSRPADRVALADQGMSTVRVLDGRTEAALGGMPSAGGFLEWLARDRGFGSLSALLTERSGGVAGAGFVLPYPTGRQCPEPDPDLRVHWVGPSGDPLAQAVEALALQAAWIVRTQAELGRTGVRDIRVIGEAVRRVPGWRDAKAAAYLGLGAATELVGVAEPVAVGAARLALVRAGLVADAGLASTSAAAPVTASMARARLDGFIAAATSHQAARSLTAP